MAQRKSVENLMHDLTRMGKVFARLRATSPTLHPGVDNAAIPLLFKLWERPLRVGELADLVHSDISTISRQATTLTRSGLVAKSPDPEDRRAQVIELTAAGREMTTRLRQERCEALSEVLREWPDEKLDALSGMIADFADTLDGALAHDDPAPRLPKTINA